MPVRNDPSQDHDHTTCVRQALDQAAALCRHRGIRLTELRRRVLEAVWQGHKPVTAYGIMESLRAEGRTVMPPTIYRALGFLLDAGLVHRIESLNAYVGCDHPLQPHASQFFICRHCGTAAERNDGMVSTAIAHSAREQGFEVQQQTIEVTGVCRSCAGSGANA